MSSISDPGRPSRGERRKVQRLVDAAYAHGRLSAAERALRTQRVAAAHTRGDLAMITRDLGESAQSSDADSPPAGPSLGSAIDPGVLRSMQVGGTYRGAMGGGTRPTINLAAMTRKIRLVIVISVVALLGMCGLGLAAAIPAFVEGFNSGSSPVPPAIPTAGPSADVPINPGAPVEPARNASLHSAAGWQALVRAIRKESGSTSVYDLVVYPTYASVGLDGGEYVERRLYREGAWQESFRVRTPIVGNPVDVGSIDPQLIETLPAKTAQRLGLDRPEGTYLIVNAIPSEPKIMVYLQADGGARYQAYTLDGTPRAP